MQLSIRLSFVKFLFTLVRFITNFFQSIFFSRENNSLSLLTWTEVPLNHYLVKCVMTFLCHKAILFLCCHVRTKADIRIAYKLVSCYVLERLKKKNHQEMTSRHVCILGCVIINRDFLHSKSNCFKYRKNPRF